MAEQCIEHKVVMMSLPQVSSDPRNFTKYYDEALSCDSDADDTNTYVSLFDSLSEEDILHLEEFAHMFFDDYIAENAVQMSSVDFKHCMCVELANALYQDLSWLDLCDADHIPEIRDWVETQCDLFYVFADIPERQESDDDHKDPAGFDDTYLCSQSQQRTQEWYAERDSMITASSTWKIFASESQRNSLIYEKCVRLNNVRRTYATSNTEKQNPMQWGAKYEPISRDLYSHKHGGIEVKEYGCIPHPQYPFLGASPDGITANGRMVEIKNIVNREITGEPLEAYWIQMQIQMEVCNLDVCDFVETRFKEFDSERAFYESNEKVRGVIMHFMPRVDVFTGEQTGTPEYVYSTQNMPLDELSIGEWMNNEKSVRTDSVLYYTYYWWLDEYSECVVKRNRAWFESAIPEIEECWNTIVREREEGFSHRAPESRKQTVAALLTAVEDSDTHMVNCVLPEHFMNIVKLE